MALSASSFTTTPSGISASPSLFSTPATSTFTPEASPTDVNTLFSGSSRSLTETSSVYINTSYTYSPTSLFSSSTPLLSTSSPLFANPTSPSSGLPSPTEASTRQRASKTASNPAASSTLRPIVPSAGQPLLQGENGLILNLSLGGDDVGQAVYSVPMVFGHASGGAYYAVLSNEDYVDGRRWRRSDDRRTDREERKRKRGQVAQGEDKRSTENLNPRPREKRAPGTYQSMNLQVDLGSSDLVRLLARESLVFCGLTRYRHQTVGCRNDVSDVGLSRERCAKTQCREFDRCRESSCYSETRQEKFVN
jgi:hypothetical protein